MRRQHCPSRARRLAALALCWGLFLTLAVPAAGAQSKPRQTRTTTSSQNAFTIGQAVDQGLAANPSIESRQKVLEQAQLNIGREVASKLIRYSNNGSTSSAVNFPEVSLPAHAGKSRLLHIHKNVPGVLARINERFSVAGINIAAQFLQTSGDIGYVVIDVDTDASQVALDQIASIEGTIRCRILY